MPTELRRVLADPALTGTSWSVAVRDLTRGQEVLSHRPDALLPTASAAKVFVLVEVAEQLAAGDLDGDLLLDRTRCPRVADSGLWQHLTVDRLPLVDVARLVGAVSDNWATNVLVDLVGLDAVQARASVLAPGGSTLCDVVRDVRGPGDPRTLSVGCAADWVAVLERLHAGAATGQWSATAVLDWLRAGVDLSMVAAAFGLDPLAHTDADRGVRLVNKTGTDDGVRADVGLVEVAGTTYAYAVICRWEASPDDPVRDHVLAAMRSLGTMLLERRT